MVYKFFAWYAATPLFWRRIVVAAFVPIQEYLFLEPCRRALNALAKFNRALALASLPLLLLAGALTAAAICLFVYEFHVGVGGKLKNKAAGLGLGLFMIGWVFIPLHFIGLLED